MTDASPDMTESSGPQGHSETLVSVSGSHAPVAVSQPDPARILVALLCPIGDTLLATPALAALHARFPRAAISAVLYRGNAGILEGNPAIAHRIVLDAGTSPSRPLRIARAASTIEWLTFDLMVNFSPAASLLGAVSGVREQVHLRLPPYWWLLGANSPSYYERHTVDHYLAVVRPLLRGKPDAEMRQPRVYISDTHRAEARRLLAERGVPAGACTIVLHAGGEGFNGRKQWSARRFAAVARHLMHARDAWVVLIGGAEDRALSRGVADLAGPHAVSLAGDSSLLESAAIIESAHLFIGNDSCPLHIAAAVNTPAVGIYGPSNVSQFRPIGAPGYRYRVVHSALPCAPCFQFVGSDAPWVPNLCYTRDCLKAISVSQVTEAALDLLAASERVRVESVPNTASS